MSRILRWLKRAVLARKNSMKLNLRGAIVPNVGLGGLRLRVHVSEMDDLVRGLGVTHPGSYKLAAPYEARYTFAAGAVEAAVDVRNGRVFKLIAGPGYEGNFQGLRIGMLVRDAIRLNPSVYYDEAEELLMIRGIEGITLDVPEIDPPPSIVPGMRIAAISVYAVEIDTADTDGPGNPPGLRWEAMPSTREPTPAEDKRIEEVLGRLREHFKIWCGPNARGQEHHLAWFAYYEGCAGRDECCGLILDEAAPFALGRELVEHHGFRWVMLPLDGEWRYGVAHPALDAPIDLFSLEDGSWNQEEYDQPPYRGMLILDSLESIVERVGRAN